MEVENIKVKYKEFLPNGIEAVMTKTFRCWKENGNYTVFYTDISEDSAAFIVPTRHMISIEIVRKSEFEEEDK